MPLRTVGVVEKNIVTDLDFIKPVIVVDSVATDVLSDILSNVGDPNSNNVPNYECAARYVQNVGANNAYYAIGFDASPVAYNGILYAGGQQLNVSDSGERVSVYAVGGTTIARTVFIRKDMVQQSRFAKKANV